MQGRHQREERLRQQPDHVQHAEAGRHPGFGRDAQVSAEAGRRPDGHHVPRAESPIQRRAQRCVQHRGAVRDAAAKHLRGSAGRGADSEHWSARYSGINGAPSCGLVRERPAGRVHSESHTRSDRRHLDASELDQDHRHVQQLQHVERRARDCAELLGRERLNKLRRASLASWCGNSAQPGLAGPTSHVHRLWLRAGLQKAKDHLL
mmetsp:Transcript_16056/g.61216  ORF Transcript_16056/g.61216 Transcript_16056/m.61216 type:complete len:206 (+) Transcript_16056:1597-2214(+)